MPKKLYYFSVWATRPKMRVFEINRETPQRYYSDSDGYIPKDYINKTTDQVLVRVYAGGLYFTSESKALEVMVARSERKLNELVEETAKTRTYLEEMKHSLFVLNESEAEARLEANHLNQEANRES